MLGTKLATYMGSASAQENCYTIERGKKQRDYSCWVQPTPTNNHWRFGQKEFSLVNSTFTLATLGQWQIEEVALHLEAIRCAPTMYDNVISNPLWRQLYQCGERKLRYVRGTNPEEGDAETTFPCMKCGLVLPERLVTVDHQRPQQGGEVEAVAKALRGIGLTINDPIGTKGRVAHMGFSGNLTKMMMLLNTSVLPSVPTKRGLNIDHWVGRDERYTLNTLGKIFLSVVTAAKAYDDLATCCMHSVLNLAPLCHVCNTSKGNKRKFA